MEKEISEFSQVQRDSLNKEFYNLVFAKTPVSTPTIHKVEVGTTVREAIEQIQDEHLDKIQVAIDSRMVRDWAVEPHKGANVVATVVPGEVISGSIILTQLLISALVVGATAIGYALFKPDEPDTDEANRLPSIRGAGNKARKYEPFRAIFGKRLITPDYIAEPYTETRGDDEWFKLLLCVGYGPLKLENFKIGDTPLEDYDHNIEYIDHYENTSESDVRSLWPADVVEDRPNVKLEGASSTSQLESTSSISGYTQSTSAAPDKISVEFFGPGGIKGDEEHRALSIDHEYTVPMDISIDDLTFGSKTIQSGTPVKVVKIIRRNVSDSTQFRPMPNTAIQMSDGSFRICVGKNLDLYDKASDRIDSRSPWDRTDGYNKTRSRNIYRRSRTIPDTAIIMRQGGLDGFLHIDMNRLNGSSRTIGVYDKDSDTFSEQSDGTWSLDSALGAYTKYGNSPRQYRGDVRYTPVHKFSTDFSDRDYSGSVSTTTRKVFPQETPNDGTLTDSIILAKFRTIRNQTEAQFQKLLGYDKPYLRYDGSPSSGIRNFRPVIIALEVRATEQLSGMIKNFNVEATSCVPVDWNADWRNWPSESLKTTVNPADCYRWLLQGPMTDAPMSNSRVNTDTLLEWRDYCDQAPPENTYDTEDQWRISYQLVENSTLMKELQKIAYTGRAEFSFDDSKYGVVVKDRKQYPVQVFSPKNSWGFTAARVYPEKVDGIRFEFDNEEKQYQQDESEFFDPRVAESNRIGKFNGTTIEGVPDHDMAYRIARMSFYEQTLQREQYKLTTDIEGLVARRGSLVRVQHDVIDVGLGSGRVVEIGADYIILDETFQLVYEEYFMDDVDITFDDQSLTFEGAINATFGIQLRHSDGTIPEEPIEGVYKGDGKFTVTSTDISGLQVGDFAVYGDLGRETQDCLVTSIEYGQDLTCQLTLTNYDDEVFVIDENPGDNPIPDFQTNLALRPEFQIPNAPSLATFDSETGIDIVKQQLYLSLEYNAQLESPVESFYFQARSIDTTVENYINDLDTEYDDDPGWEFVGAVPYGETQFTYQGIGRGTAYRIRARSRGRGDLYSAYSDPVNAIVPLDFPPPSISATNFTYEHKAEGTIVSWDRINDPDREYFEVRTDTNVGNATGLLARVNDTEANIGYLNSPINNLYVFPRTVYGTYADSSPSISITTPSVATSIDTGSLTVSQSDLNISLSWVFPAILSTQYEIDYVTVKQNKPGATVSFSSADLLDETLSTNLTLTNQDRGTHTFWFQVVFKGGLVGPEVQYNTDVPFYIPPKVDVRTQVDGSNGTRIKWQAVSSTVDFDAKDLVRYEVRSEALSIDSGGIPASLPDDKLISTTNETSLLVDYIKDGSEPTYYIYGVSRFGYYSLTAGVTTPNAPSVGAPQNILTVPIDNTVVLDWEDPSSIIYPIKHYEVWEKKPGRVTYDKIGTFSATYANMNQREGGLYTYKILTVDSAGNVSSTLANADPHTIRVFDPTDFTLGYYNDTDLSTGTYQYGHQDLNLGSKAAYFPVRDNSPGGVDNKTLQTRIDEAAAASGKSSSTVTIQDKINNVGPYIPQYTKTTGEFESYYQKVYDIFNGAPATDLFLVNNTVNVDVESTQLADTNVDVRTFIEFSEDNSTWSTPVETTQIFKDENFRYIRVTIYFDINGDTSQMDLVRMDSLIVQVEVKKRTEQGSDQVIGTEATSGGTKILFPTEKDEQGNDVSVFLDLDSIVATVDYGRTAGFDKALDDLAVYTRFDDTARPDGFYAFVKNNQNGQFVDAVISWVARGI